MFNPNQVERGHNIISNKALSILNLWYQRINILSWDNRDDSRESRFWGFIQRKILSVQPWQSGLVFEYDRKDAYILPSWLPTNIRFSRIGSIIKSLF